MMGLAFLSPWFLLGALAVALPVLLHLRKQDIAPRTRSPPSASCAARRSRRGGRGSCATCCCWRCAWRRWRCWPRRSRVRTSAARTPVGGITIVAVDTSFSMGAPGRMAKAKDAALRAVAAAPAGRYGLALMRPVDDRAVVLAEPSLDRGARARRHRLAHGRQRAARRSPRCGARRRAWRRGQGGGSS
jgi:hypothetical protein